ncbi:MAG: hypothetical protein L6R39_004911 [Caloplaca ligustica]|nr:MAG: hypothetical protein L6R39_004911 [Caloplaca ligustica]
MIPKAVHICHIMTKAPRIFAGVTKMVPPNVSRSQHLLVNEKRYESRLRNAKGFKTAPCS